MLLVVVLGAFGAHGLEGRIDPDRMEAFRTAVRYHAWHALGLFAVAACAARYPGRRIRWSGVLVVTGTILFSGSLYALAMTGWTGLGMVTPVGGLCWIVAWGLLALGVAAPGAGRPGSNRTSKSGEEGT
jgi:uncharacterized membrane protein YgdD (TMEM256/DUF423 family)